MDACNASDSIANAQMVLELKQAGYFVNVYTANDKKRKKELFAMGVNAVFSDRLKYLKKSSIERKEKTKASRF